MVEAKMKHALRELFEKKSLRKKVNEYEDENAPRFTVLLPIPC